MAATTPVMFWDLKIKQDTEQNKINNYTWAKLFVQIYQKTKLGILGWSVVSVLQIDNSTIKYFTSAAAGLSVMATETSPGLESLDMGPKGGPKNIADGSVLISCNLICDPWG